MGFATNEGDEDGLRRGRPIGLTNRGTGARPGDKGSVKK